MHPNPNLESTAEPHPYGSNGRVAGIFDTQRDDIIHEWLDQVLEDPGIPTDSLTVDQVRGQFPQLFDDLTGTMSRDDGGLIAEKSRNDCGQYGAARWQQGFELPAMLRELTHFRCILIDRLVLFEADNDDFGMVARLYVIGTLHRFLKQMGIDAVGQFLNEGVHQREHAKTAA